MKEETQKFYKVLNFEENNRDLGIKQLHSYNTQYTGDGLLDLNDTILIYKEGEWISAPNNTLLFVWTDKKTALTYRGKDRVIYECEVDGTVIHHGNGFYTDRPTMANYADYWHTLNKNLQEGKEWDAGMNRLRLWSHHNVAMVSRLKLTNIISDCERD